MVIENQTVGKTVGETVRWEFSKGAKKEDGCVSENSVNFSEKTTSYWNQNKNWKIWGNFFNKFRKYRKNLRNFRKLWKIFRNFESFFSKIPKSEGIFQKILKISKIFSFFTQNWYKNNKLYLKLVVMEKQTVGKTVGETVRWEFSKGAKNGDGCVSENSVNFFEKPTSYWNLNKNERIVEIFSKNFENSEKFQEILEIYGKILEISKNFFENSEKRRNFSKNSKNQQKIFIFHSKMV